MLRYGTLLRFKAGLDREEAERALQTLIDAGVLDTEGVKLIQGKYTPTHLKAADLVKEYDDTTGGPVWYIP